MTYTDIGFHLQLGGTKEPSVDNIYTYPGLYFLIKIFYSYLLVAMMFYNWNLVIASCLLKLRMQLPTCY